MGVSAERAVAGLVAAGADVVGSNCGTGIGDMVQIARAMAAAGARRIAIQPNAGLPETRDGAVTYNESPESMASRVGELLEIGVSVVGGCCGTTPDHIRAIRKAVDAWRRRANSG
jgi:5-methyltetrahydrofolate--homocysteine methyltransferase